MVNLQCIRHTAQTEANANYADLSVERSKGTSMQSDKSLPNVQSGERLFLQPVLTLCWRVRFGNTLGHCLGREVDLGRDWASFSTLIYVAELLRNGEMSL